MQSGDILAIAQHFDLDGAEYISNSPHGNGHINDTYAATYRKDGRWVRYIHQRINHGVFKNPPEIMKNIQRVTDHIRGKLGQSGVNDLDRRVLKLIPARDGQPFYRDLEGSYWRTYKYIERTKAIDVLDTPEQAYQAAFAFGQFQQLLDDLPGERLHDSIPGFHDGPARFATFKDALAKDIFNRVATIPEEISFAINNEAIVHRLPNLLKAGDIKERITHNDTKINNILLDIKSGEGICVIDLDTTMTGLSLYDFGDLGRTTLHEAAEDERNLKKIQVQLPVFEQLVKGFLASASDILTPKEIELLPFACKLITFIIGLRFLTDHLNGDIYFKIHRPNHNLDRCRTQFKLVQEIDNHQQEMLDIIENVLET